MLRRHEVLSSGAVAGVAGGVAMMVVLALGATSQGMAVTHPLVVIGGTFIGPGALGSVAAKVAFGALVHLSVSAALGILFASIVPSDFDTTGAVGVGVAFSLFAIMILLPVVVPWANPEFQGEMQRIGGTWVIAHAVFGCAVGTTPALRRWLDHRTSRASAPEAKGEPAVGSRAPAQRASS